MGISTKTASRRPLFATMAAAATVALVSGLLALVTSVGAAAGTPNVTTSTSASSVPADCRPKGGSALGFCWNNRANNKVTFYSKQDGIDVIFLYRYDEYRGTGVDPGKSVTIPKTDCNKAWDIKVSGPGYSEYYTLPKCSTSTATTGKARGDLIKKSCTKVKVKLDTKKVTRGTTKYRVLQSKGKKVKKSYAVKAKTRKTFTLKVKKSQKVTLTLQVKRPTGKWAKLDKVKVPRC